MVGIVNNEIMYTPFANCVKELKSMPDDLLKMIKVLAK
jgi:hypothetical protein